MERPIAPQRHPAPEAPKPLAGLTPPSHSLYVPFREWLSSYQFPYESCGKPIQVLTEPPVFISNRQAAADEALLKQYKIGVVISLEAVPDETVKRLGDGRIVSSMDSFYQRLGIKRYYFPFPDSSAAKPSDVRAAYDCLTEVCKQYQDGKTNILVHCVAGLSRSVSLVAARAAKSLGCSLQEVVEHFARLRNVGIDQDLAHIMCGVADIKIDASPASEPMPK